MGGVAGHLSHLYDNRNITFNEMKKILSLASQGDLVGTEKTDGYNIFLGLKGDEPVYARNKGDMSTGGEDITKLQNREWAGGAKVKKVYVDAFSAYIKAMNSLTPVEKDMIFGPERNIFYNTEIQGPGASNVVNYDANVVSIHHAGHRIYNPETDKVEVIDVTKNSKKLDSVIDRFEQATADENFSVRRTAFLELQALDGDHDLNIALNKIQKAGFTGDMTIEEYLENNIRSLLDSRLTYFSGITREQIIDRILDRRDENKKPLATLTQIYKGFPIEQKKIITDFVKLGPQMIKNAIWPVENAIHDFAVELLKGLKSAYILDNEAEVKRLKNEVDQAIKAIQKYQGPGADEAHEILAKQLEKIKHHSNVNTAVEGFVFQYGDQLYKFTGNFAPANQILGLFRFGRGGIKIPKDDSKPIVGETDILSEEPEKIVALVPGKFKPPHRGHLDMVRHYAQIADVVKVMISPIAKDDISWEDSKAIWEIYFRGDSELSNVVAMKSPQNSPVGAAFDYVENKSNDPNFSQPGEGIILGASTKGGDQSRFAGNVEKYAQEGVRVLNPMDFIFGEMSQHSDHYRALLEQNHEIYSNMPSVADSSKDFMDFHGSDMRYLTGLAKTDEIAAKLLQDYLPVNTGVSEVLRILSTAEEEKKSLTMEYLFSLVENILEEVDSEKQRKWACAQTGDSRKNFKGKPSLDSKEAEEMCKSEIEEEELEEISAMGTAGAGNVEGYAVKKDENEQETLIREED